MQAPSWTLLNPPVGVVVPDTAEGLGGRLAQRQALAATVFPDGEVLLLLAGPAETRVIMTDPALRRLMDVADPGRMRHDSIPPMQAGWGRPWAEGGRLARSGEEAVLAGWPLDGPFNRGLTDLELIYLGPEGRRTRPPVRIAALEGTLLGAFSDGSLLMTVASLDEFSPVADTVASVPFRVARPRQGSEGARDTVDLRVLFTAGLRTARGGRGGEMRRISGSHEAWTKATTSGDTVWIVPSERPELVALDLSGDVLLRVEWEAGDRSVPPGNEDLWKLARHPAAAAVIAGADGQVFVQRIVVRDGRPVQGPEWLVFGTAGDLIARLDIPTSLRVLAFGPGTVLVVATAEGGHREVRLHALGRAER